MLFTFLLIDKSLKKIDNNYHLNYGINWYMYLTRVLKMIYVSYACHTQAKRKCLLDYNIDI